MIYTKREVVLVELGKPPLEIKGHEQAFKRPCLILSMFYKINIAIVVPFTTTLPKKRYFTMVEVDKGQSGLSQKSYCLCHQIRAISTERVIKKMGLLDSRDFNKVITVISHILGIR